MSSNIDTNVSNYTLAELMVIIDLNDLDPEEIIKKTDYYIEKYKTTDPNLSIFFQSIQDELLQYIEPNETKERKEDNNEQSNIEKQTKDWYENEYQTQPENPVQNNKITEREQKIDVYDNKHVPMTQQQLGINNTYSVPIAQDKLNPTLKNITTRFVNLDSQFRQSANNAESTASDYTLDLSDPLTNVLNMKFYSFQIPLTWYVIDDVYGNTCFWITEESVQYNIPITIDPGNYSNNQFVTAVNTAFLKAGFNTSSQVPILYNSINGKITLNLYGLQFQGTTTYPNEFTITNNTIVTFFDYTARLQCTTLCVNQSYYLDQTLGWLMGYREPYLPIDPSGNTAPAVLNLNGTKYLILVIDDYNQNHLNNGLVSITEYYNTIKTPNYYSPDLPYTCLAPNAISTGFGNDLSNIITGINNENSNGLLVADKMTSNIRYSKTAQLLPSAPRTLTQAQLYTINEIFKKNNNTTNYRTKAPTTPDIFALIPVKSAGGTTGELLVEFSGSLQQNIRTYFGPVNIERMRIRLLDDKGNQVNLNGGDWCFTVICECLYQY
jgi:hypothetical protein